MNNQHHFIKYMLGIMVLFAACEKVEDGYISDYISYNLRTLEATQGQVVYTKSLVLDGSTSPVNVRLLSVRNKRTGREAPEMLATYDIPTYLAEITDEDVTLEQLQQKIAVAKVAPLEINTIGGRVGLSSATTYVDTGLYTIDIEVTNSRGTRVINEALDIRLRGAATDTILYQALTSSDLGSETNFVTDNNYQIDITHDISSENKIVFKWVDKHGNAFNPKTGEVIKRGDRPTFANWSPYYEEQLTDTALVYPFPNTGLAYPILKSVTVNGANWVDGIVYYRVKGSTTDIGRNINTVGTFKFYLGGTYIVTYHLNSVVRKP
jgi:hypothetical protein